MLFYFEMSFSKTKIYFILEISKLFSPKKNLKILLTRAIFEFFYHKNSNLSFFFFKIFKYYLLKKLKKKKI